MHAQNYRFFWKGLCFKYLLLTLSQRAALFEGDLFWVDQYDPPTFILEEELIQHKFNLIQFLSNISEIIPSQKVAVVL